MLISMAVGASRRNSQKGFPQVHDLERRSFISGNVFWCVTSIASEAGVCAHELVPGLAVNEGFDIPFREDEIFAVVFGVAIHAFLAGARLDVVCSVQSLSGNDAGRDFVVTTQALEYRFAGRDFVAADAIGHSADRLVRARKRAGRDLRCSRN
jgi:hypothetical protein